MANYDILGDIAILKFHKTIGKKEKLEQAKQMLESHSNLKTVLEKTDKVSGRLRTIKTKFLAGEKTLIADYKENGCRFKLNVETCYFSPRLASERLKIAKLIAKLKAKKVLVMFSGVGPFTIVIAKNTKTQEIVSIELGKDCCKYASQNLRLNKIYSGVKVIQGDVNKVVKKGGLIVKGNLVPLHFDVIVMPRPNLKDTFLKAALSVAKKNTLIIYYGFCAEAEKDRMTENLLKEVGKLKRKIKILSVKEAGDIAPYEHRYRIEIKVLN